MTLLPPDCIKVVISKCDSLTRAAFLSVSKETAAVVVTSMKKLEITTTKGGNIDFCPCHKILRWKSAVWVYGSSYGSFKIVTGDMVVEYWEPRMTNPISIVRQFLIDHDITPSEFGAFVKKFFSS